MIKTHRNQDIKESLLNLTKDTYIHTYINPEANIIKNIFDTFICIITSERFFYMVETDIT